MNIAEYLRKDTAHMFIPLIMLPPFNLACKTLRTLLIIIIIIIIKNLFEIGKFTQLCKKFTV